jgi:hypothetical protein
MTREFGIRGTKEVRKEGSKEPKEANTRTLRHTYGPRLVTQGWRVGCIKLHMQVGEGSGGGVQQRREVARAEGS